MDNDIYKRGLIIVGCILVLLITIFGYKLSQKQKALEIQSVKNNTEIIETESNNDEIEVESQEPKNIIVDVSGAVINPGVYTLEDGARLNDAIILAGGLSEDVDEEFVSKHINKSRVLTDAEKIYIPSLDDEMDVVNDTDIYSSYESDYSSLVGDGLKASGKININTASKEQLMTLSGIGEAYSDRIIDYRRQHPFKSIEEIKEVKGIGDKTFEKIMDFIVVN